MDSKTLNSLVMMRFESKEEIERHLKTLGATNPQVEESTSDMTEEQDYMFDGCINKGSDDDSDYFTLYYIFDRCRNYYITETNFWG